MKALVLYASKYGYTAAYAQAMVRALGADAKAVDLEGGGMKGLALGEYEAVLAGSGVYAGKPRASLKGFLSKYAAELSSKKLGLFLVGRAGPVEGKPAIDATFSPDLQQKAAVAYLPGWIDKNKLGFVMRWLIDMIEKAEAKKGTPPATEPPNVEKEAAAFVAAVLGKN